jgi:DNA invertase Pin-like site-specific DNA recombinase
MSSLDDLRSLVDAQRIIDAQIRKLAIDALREGASRSTVAYILGISRASLYRHFGEAISGDVDAPGEFG